MASFNIMGSGGFKELNDIETWLSLGGVSGSYSTLSDILADTTALNKLMTTQKSIDYLVGCDDFISQICASQNGMNAIGNSNLCANSLLEHDNWILGITNSDYVENVMNIKVPIMTSNTTPSGECFAGRSKDTNRAPWKAFDGNITYISNDYWLPASDSVNNYIGYVFNRNVKIFSANVYLIASTKPQARAINVVVQSGIDKNNFTDISQKTSCMLTYNQVVKSTIVCNKQQSVANSFRIYDPEGVAWHTDGLSTSLSVPFIGVQFYGRQDI